MWRAGLAWVPLNPATPPADLRCVIDAFDCEVLFYHPSMAPVVAELAPSLPKVAQYVCLEDAADAVIADAPVLRPQGAELPLVQVSPAR
ncbi:hypothetical protein ACWGK9_37525, partial [Streptomyces rubiginosohelvolus]